MFSELDEPLHTERFKQLILTGKVFIQPRWAVLDTPGDLTHGDRFNVSFCQYLQSSIQDCLSSFSMPPTPSCLHRFARTSFKKRTVFGFSIPLKHVPVKSLDKHHPSAKS